MRSLFSLRFELKRKGTNHDVLVVFSAAAMVDPEELATLIESEIEANLVPDQLMLVVREVAFVATRQALDENSQHLATLTRLANRATVTLVGYGLDGREASRDHVRGPKADAQVGFDDFRRRGVTSIFNTRHGFVESTSTYHFENPSGRHTDRFIRLSNILARGAEIAFIAFCVLPEVPAATRYAYLDTPSLYPVIAAINEQRLAFGSAPPLLADNFSSYAGIDQFIFDKLEDAFVLISASSSGSLAAKLVKEKGFAAAKIAHLLFLGEDKSES